MMKVAVVVKQSPVHGLGLFAVDAISAGTELFRFVAHQPNGSIPTDCDFKVPLEKTDDEEKHFGWICPRTPDMLSICGDHARYWNFSPLHVAPNAIAQGFDEHGEDIIVAARDIEAGEELLLDMATDLDASRKLNLALIATS